MTRKNKLINEDSCFNIPIIATRDASYLGDNDVLLKKNGYRTMTGICSGDCQIYSVKKNDMDEILEKNLKVKAVMYKVAKEKQKYYDALKDDLKVKYRSKKLLEDLYKKKKDSDWTNYISPKRQMVKRQNASQNRVTNMMKNVRNHELNEL